MNSPLRIGVTMTCSMVPISFSRTMARDESSMVMMNRMLVITAGT